ncbi:MAG TPA: DoxX family protein [Candidatus Krumholzibacteria bacterium]|nr:DoxX family protein [Candidatus Krumholzibacteria bacterium]
MFGKLASSEGVAKDFGLLLIRLGVSVFMFCLHGYGKITGGPERWEGTGGAMANLGITFMPVAWGFLAAFAESVGSILIVLGPLFRVATLMLAFNMFVATMMHMNLPTDNPASGFAGAEKALVYMTVYLGLFFAGPGRFAAKLTKAERR